MKPMRILAGVITGALLAFVLAGCAPKGGTLTLVNESKYVLTKPEISLGGAEEDFLMPGQWMKSSVDKNIPGANVRFILVDGENKVTVSQGGGSFRLNGLYISGLIRVQDGDSVVVTVRDKN